MTEKEPGVPQVVRGTEILPADPTRVRRQKLARITLDSMVQFVGLLDAHGTVLEINQVALDAVGITLAEVEGRPFWTTFWWQVSDEINATLREAISRAAQGEFVRWDAEIYGRAGGRETIIIDASVVPVLDDDGRVVFICAEGRDITEKKAQEREIARKNVDLQGLLERIRELDEIKTQFFANVSHELRTPLALIIGPAERLLDADADTAATADARRESARVILRNGRMLLKHVNDLLDISKLEAGKLKIELEDTDVAASLRYIASHFDILAAERGVSLAVEAPAALVAAVDREKVERIAMNLLSNAFKFVPPAGTVRCRLAATDGVLRLQVDDSGPGVPPALRKTVFERFRQGEGGANRRAAGTGLGLAIAQEFAGLHKGSIELEDSDLGGARFEVVLPVRPPASNATPFAAPPQRSDASTLDGVLEELRAAPVVRDAGHSRPNAGGADGPGAAAGRPRVLVIEDNADMNRFVAQCLSRDYRVLTAFDGHEGLALALAEKPDLIVSDVMMPAMGGEEMIAALRARPEMDAVPVVLLSAKADDELRTRLLEHGAQDFVTKPFAERDLLVRVRNLVGTKRSHEASLEADSVRLRDVEAAHLDLEERSDLLWMLSEDMLARADYDGNMTAANAAWTKVLGYPNEQILARPYADIIHPDDLPATVAALESMGRTGRPTRFENRILAASGAWKPIGWTVSPEPDGVHFIAIGRDLADYKARERELLQAQEALRQSQKMEAVGQLTGGLAHDFNNLLAAISGSLQVLQARLDKGRTDGVERYVEMAHSNVRRAASLTQRLLAFSRRQTLDPRPVDINRLVAGMEELVRRTVGPTVEVEVVCAPALWTSRIDASQLESSLLNLCINARDAMLPQGGRLTITTANESLDAGAARARELPPGQYVSVCVTDTGTGMAPEVIERAFDPFYTTKPTGLGTGLGLSMVYGFVRQSGGQVRIDSTPGRGTTVCIHLPRHPGAADAQASDAQGARIAPGAGETVLVIEDEPTIRVLLVELLEEAGYRVLVAQDGPSGLRLLEAEGRIDLLLTDVGLPGGLNGRQVADAGRVRRPGLKVLFITGYAEKAAVGNGQLEPGMAVITKPFDLAGLANKVRQMIEA